jgi:pimeloyl-ACP methyl ester carboxylesterase
MTRHAAVLFLWLAASANAATLRVPAQFGTIQTAIDRALAGDQVVVSPGTYREPLRLRPGVIVKSAGNDDKGRLGLKRAEATVLEGGVRMAEKAVLDGFTITGVGRYDDKLWRQHFDTQGGGQEHESIGVAGTPGIAVPVTCEVRNNIVHHIGSTGIAITGGSPRIVRNICHRNMGGGIGSMSGSTAAIEKNLCFENFHAGIGCDGASPLIRDNECHTNIRAGIGVSEGSSPEVSRNHCHGNIRAGIGLRDRAKARIEDNRLHGNKLVAIGVTSGSDAVIRSNDLAREGGTPPLIAIMEDSKALITGNTLRGGGVAAIVVKGGAGISRNHFVLPGPKKTILASKGATVTQSGNMLLTDVVFQSTLDGTAQRCVELVPDDAPPVDGRDVLLALHGHGSDRWQFINDPRGECRALRDVAARHGLIYLSPDYRAKTSWMGPKAETDVLQIIGDVRRRHHVRRVFVAGGSMGGTSALIFAALHPGLIAGVCAMNPTANLVEYGGFKDAIDASYGGAAERRKRSPELRADQLTMPVSLSTGGQDRIVPPDSALRLASRLKRVLSLHRPEGGHSTSYDDAVKAMEFVLQSADSAKAPAGRP